MLNNFAFVEFFAVSNPAVFVLTSPMYSKRLPPAVIRVHSFSDFYGRRSQQMRAFVIILPSGIMCLSIQKHVFVHLILCVPSAFFPMP